MPAGLDNANTQITFKAAGLNRVNYAPWFLSGFDGSAYGAPAQAKKHFRSFFNTRSEKSPAALHIYLAQLTDLNDPTQLTFQSGVRGFGNFPM